MTQIRRFVLRAAVATVVVMIGLGIYGYFAGTRLLLEQAEALNFRRMTVSHIADQGTFRFFYVTNRTFEDTGNAVEESFSQNRQEQLQFGSFDTAIEPTLGLGMLIDSSSWFLNEEIQLSRVTPLEQQGFVDKLKAQVQSSPHGSLLIVVHGFREAFPSALRKTAFLGHILDINTPVLVFDWPGNQGSSLRGYRGARRVATASGPDLANLLRLVVDQVQPERLWLMANSMGGEVVVSAFHNLSNDPDFADSDLEIEDLVLTAPDVGREEFNAKFKQEIQSLAASTSVYVSSNDRALLVSRLINRGARLGESTLDPSNPDQIEQTQALVELIEPGEDYLSLIDVTAVNRTRNFHNFSLETPEFFDDLFLRLLGEGLPKSRELYELRTPEGSRYFVITRAR